MLKRIIVLTFPVVLAWCGFALTARAAVVDTFSFTTSGWGISTLSGQFSGTVEPDGLIEQTDLTAFQATGFNGARGINLSGPGSLSFFSYNTAGGASSFDLIATVFNGITTTVCIGASATLSPTCNPQGTNPAPTRAVILVDSIPFDFTSDPPAVTLVSSVPVPEPGTWATTLLGFAILGFAGYRSRKSAGPIATRGLSSVL
ncbi:MAG: PEP-CTERM sorting domain-containing protein [Roseiarcus sp.]